MIKSKVMGYQAVCSIKDLEHNIGKRFLIDDVDLAVFKVADKVYVMSNYCPHNQSALIYDGFIEDNHVVCPVHGWMFNLETGKTPSGCGKLQIYESKVIDDYVYVKVFKKDYKW